LKRKRDSQSSPDMEKEIEVKGSIIAAFGVISLGSSFAVQASFTDFDTSFGNGGAVTITDPETKLAADILDASEGADGNIYLLVGADEVARLTPTGAPDTSFGTNGFLVLSGASSTYTLYDLAVDSANQKIYVATQDNANVTDSSTAVTLAAFDFSGNAVSSFGSSGSVSFASLGNAYPTGLQLLGNGTLLLDGQVEEQGNPASPPAFFAVEASSAGVPSSTFGTSGVAQLSVPTTTAGLSGQEIYTYKSAVDSTGRVYVVGGSQGTVGLLARFTAAGQPDSSFGNSGLVAQSLTTTANAEAEFELVSVQANGSITAFGSYYPSPSSSSSLTGVLDTFNSSGALDATSTSPDNDVPYSPNYLQQTDGKFVIVSAQQAAPGSSTTNPNVVRLLGTSVTTGSTSVGTTAGSTTGTTSIGNSTSGGSGSASPLMLLLGFAAFLRRKFAKA
jgi:uncharacterized delta-60 repeat protein